MSYRSVSPHIKLSCYNCRYFDVSSDMLNGFCRYNTKQSKAAIGIGTCEQFSAKNGPAFSWSSMLDRSHENETPKAFPQ